MPRLLSINSYHYRRGGSDVVYLEHAALLEALGWSNAFYAMHHPQNLATPWSRFFIDELEFDHDYPAWRKLAMAGKVVYSFEAQRRLEALLAEYPADVAHLHCIYHHHSPSILPTLHAAGVPTVLTAHDLKIACPAYKMLNDGGICERCRDGSVLNVLRHRCVRGSLAASAVVAVESALHRRLDTWRRHVTRVVSPSRFFIDKFVEWGWPRERFVHIPNVVDAARFEAAPEPGGYLLYFGRLAVEKGVATLLRAAQAAGVPLKIAGTGPLAGELQALHAQIGGDVEFLGYRSGAALHDLVRGSRAVVLPSQWYENAPMSVLESMALGKPVLGARIGGIPELIVEGETGWTFESGSVAQLAERLREIAGSGAAALAAMGRAARAHVEREFPRARYADAMLALYASLGVRA
ncbi:MAG: glycosyltransferase family 4 protein [Piscinibacter sp.]|nr:glycosyltransferase family 4 protein [Piscinibacter sp.]